MKGSPLKTSIPLSFSKGWVLIAIPLCHRTWALKEILSQEQLLELAGPHRCTATICIKIFWLNNENQILCLFLTTSRNISWGFVRRRNPNGMLNGMLDTPNRQASQQDACMLGGRYFPKCASSQHHVFSRSSWKWVAQFPTDPSPVAFLLLGKAMKGAFCHSAELYWRACNIQHGSHSVW